MKTKKSNFYSSILLGVMTLVLAAAFDGIANTVDAKLTQVCFEFEGPNSPGDEAATTPALYDPVVGDPDCDPLRLTLCGICFDTTEFALDENLQPDFSDDELARIVNENKTNFSMHGQPITDSATGKTVTFYFRNLG